MLTLRLATSDDLSALINLLMTADMDYVEPIEDYTLAFENEMIVGCIRLENHVDKVMIRPLVVAENYRNKGIGKYIIENVIPDDKPSVIAARGKAIPFYISVGFINADWQSVSDQQREECKLCSEHSICNPQPMIYIPNGCKK